MGVLMIMQMLVLHIPVYAGYVLPLACFLTVLAVNGKFYVSREFDVLFACGVSRLRLLMVTMFFVVTTAIVMGFLVMWVIPYFNGISKRLSMQMMSSISVDHALPKKFSNFNNTVFYANKVDRYKSTLEDVFLAKEKSDAVWNVVFARRGSIADVPQTGHSAILENGTQYQVDLKGLDYKKTRFSRYIHNLQDSVPKNIRYRPYEIPFSQLWAGRRHNNQYDAQIQWFFAMPISVLILGLSGFALSKVQVRSGKFAKFIPAIVLYAAYMNFLFLNKGWMAKGQMDYITGYYWPHAIMLLVALALCASYFGWFRRCKS